MLLFRVLYVGSWLSEQSGEEDGGTVGAVGLDRPVVEVVGHGEVENGRRLAVSSMAVVRPPWMMVRSQAARWRYRSGNEGAQLEPLPLSGRQAGRVEAGDVKVIGDSYAEPGRRRLRAWLTRDDRDRRAIE